MITRAWSLCFVRVVTQVFEFISWYLQQRFSFFLFFIFQIRLHFLMLVNSPRHPTSQEWNRSFLSGPCCWLLLKIAQKQKLFASFSFLLFVAIIYIINWWLLYPTDHHRDDNRWVIHLVFLRYTGKYGTFLHFWRLFWSKIPHSCHIHPWITIAVSGPRRVFSFSSQGWQACKVRERAMAMMTWGLRRASSRIQPIHYFSSRSERLGGRRTDPKPRFGITTTSSRNVRE